MLFCTLAVSAVILTSKPAGFHTVTFWDNQHQLSQTVLDRSLCDTILKRTPMVTANGIVYNQSEIDAQRSRYQKAAGQHCQKRLTVEGIASPSVECGEGFKR